MAINRIIYNRAFYQEQKTTNYSSAKIIYPILENIIQSILPNEKTRRVCDVGCGTGNWLSVFKKNGWGVMGFDGTPYSDELCIEKKEFQQCDLHEKIDFSDKFDLVLCLEVAEHIAESHSDQLIDRLTKYSDIILFSAAIPFQMGQGHLNEQYPSYWISKFEKKGYKVCDCIREEIWDMQNVRHFYKQNMLLFVKDCPEYLSFINKYSKKKTLDLVHPETWEKVQGWLPVRLYVRMYNNPLVYRIYQIIKKIRGIY